MRLVSFDFQLIIIISNNIQQYFYIIRDVLLKFFKFFPVSALQSYSFENIMYHVLHERVPKPPFSALTRWWKESPRTRNKVLNHYTIRAHATLRILNQLDVISVYFIF